MDKATILEIVNATIDDLNNASVPKMFATNRLHGLVSLLHQDDKAEASQPAAHADEASGDEVQSSSQVITYKGVSIPISQWIEGARRRKITCSRLRHERDEARQARDQALLERDAAREHIAKQGGYVSNLCGERDELERCVHGGLVERDKLQAALSVANSELDELKRHLVGFDHVVIVRSKRSGAWEAACGGGTLYSDRDGAILQVETLLKAIEPQEGDRDASSVTIGNVGPFTAVDWNQPKNRAMRYELYDAYSKSLAVSDRLAALEDHVELMGAQFAEFKTEVNGDLDNLDDRVKLTEDRLDAFKAI